VLLLLLASSSGRAQQNTNVSAVRDTLLLKDGRTLKGSVIDVREGERVLFRLDNGVETEVPLSAVDRIAGPGRKMQRVSEADTASFRTFLSFDGALLMLPGFLGHAAYTVALPMGASHTLRFSGGLGYMLNEEYDYEAGLTLFLQGAIIWRGFRVASKPSATFLALSLIKAGRRSLQVGSSHGSSTGIRFLSENPLQILFLSAGENIMLGRRTNMDLYVQTSIAGVLLDKGGYPSKETRYPAVLIGIAFHVPLGE
jgi:hypothetical protein